MNEQKIWNKLINAGLTAAEVYVCTSANGGTAWSA